MQQLEQRVKSLEYEVKILKNEIQRTLLDIQEQILVHYYPSLRAEESGPTGGTVQSLATIRAKKQQLGGDSNPSMVQEASELPGMSKISLEDIRAQEATTHVSEEASPPPVEGAMNENQSKVMELSGWVSQTAQKIGGGRTTQLIQACTSEGVLTSDLERPLLRLAGLIITTDSVPEQVLVNDVLGAILKLNELLGRNGNVDEALSLIEAAHLG